MVMMFNVKEVGVGVASVASAVMVGYCYMQKRDKRQKSLLKAMEDINRVFAKEKNEWEETKDKVLERLLSQEGKVKDMEEERKTRDVKLLGMEKRLEELEAEEKRTCQVIAALKEVSLRGQLRREKQEKQEREALADKWEEERLQLIRDKEALLERFLCAERQNEDMRNQAKMIETHALEMEEKMKCMEERRTWEEERLHLISAEHNGEMNMIKTIEDKVLLQTEKIENVQLVNSWTPQFCELTLDPNTVNRNLSLSENNRTVTRVERNQSYPDHPNRFDICKQVLCTEGLTGRCYWEVDWSGSISIAVTYRGINRRGRGDDSLFGHNDKSWSLDCYEVPQGSRCKVPDCLKVSHNGKPTILWTQQDSVHPCSNRVRVYLDWPAGTLSFYGVSADSRTHLYTFQSRFTEPLYAGFGFRPYSWSDSSVSLCQMEVQ